MKEDTIENINRDLLVKMIGQHEFLGVFFCKSDSTLQKVALKTTTTMTTAAQIQVSLAIRRAYVPDKYTINKPGGEPGGKSGRIDNISCKTHYLNLPPQS